MRTIVGSLAAGAVLVSAATVLAGPDAESTRVGLLEISGAPRDQPGPMDWLFGSGENPTLRELVGTINEAAKDERIGGLVLRLKDAELGAAQVEELGEAMRRAREAGKKVHVFAESYGAAELMLGGYADEVIAQSGGAVSLPGLYMEEMFLADTLAWAGLRADFVQVGDYKGASEQMARNAPSPQWEENISQLLDSLYARMRAPIIAGRKMSDAKLDAAMETAWLADADDARKIGLLDTVVDLPALTDHLKTAYGNEVAWKTDMRTGEAGPKVDVANPFAFLSVLSKVPDKTPKGPTIAVLHVNGPIMDGDSGAGGFTGGGTVGSRTIRNAIEDIMKQDQIKGVVVRIDSPGGSATASEVIWQGLRRLAATRPVWVSVGSMAASGGYYIAVAGDKIYVNPSSIVGSIGVVGGKISMQGLYDKLKIRVVGRGRGPRAEMFASARPWEAADLAAVRQKMTETYDLFTSRVKTGRKGIDLAKTAEGRLFTGDKALGLKMADKIGGLEAAIADLADSVSLDEYEVMDYPGPKSFTETIEDALKGFTAAPGVKSNSDLVRSQLFGAMRELLGDRAWRQMEPAVTGFMQMRDEPVMLLSPRVLIVR